MMPIIIIVLLVCMVAMIFIVVYMKSLLTCILLIITLTNIDTNELLRRPPNNISFNILCPCITMFQPFSLDQHSWPIPGPCPTPSPSPIGPISGPFLGAPSNCFYVYPRISIRSI